MAEKARPPKPGAIVEQPKPDLPEVPVVARPLALPHQPPSIWRWMHSHLRGRYLSVVALGLLCGAASGFLAWRQVKPPTYASEGLVRIAYSLPQVREETDHNQPLPMFETFMSSQKTLITSRRVIDMAAADPLWQKTGRVLPRDLDTYFADHLHVEIKAKSELIRISVHDHDPVMAAAAVTSIINAYAELYNSQNKRLERQRLGVLDDQLVGVKKRMHDLEEQVRQRAAEYGTTQLDPIYNSLGLQRTKLESALSDIHLAISGAAAPSAASTQPATLHREVPIAQIAAVDPLMRTYYDELGRLQDHLTRLQMTSGPAHPRVLAAQRDLDIAQARVESYAQTYRQYHAGTPTGIGEARGVVSWTAGKSVEALWAAEAGISKLLQKIKQEMVAVGNTRMELQRLDVELAVARTEYSKLAQRVEVLRGEEALGGRLSIISTGEVSLAPANSRQVQIASMATLVGALLPAGAVLVSSLARRRYRYSDEPANDAALGKVRLLGLLPDVGARRPSEDLMLSAAYAVHHLRVLLRPPRSTEAQQVFLVTSATPGEGKTSLTMALACSFAAAKQRTLVIDCDFVGRRLTHGFRAQYQPGLFDALAGGSWQEHICRASPYLHVLPSGRTRPADACGITEPAIRRVLAEARRNFDVVLVDTGPILGSPESAVVAREVDGVLVTIARGQQPARVEQAMRRLQALGAPVVGAVFNRAELRDFRCSSYMSESAGPLSQRQLSPDAIALQQSVENFGPLVRAVVFDQAA